MSKVSMIGNPWDHVSPETLVEVHLSGAGGGGGNRIKVDEALTFEQLGISTPDGCGAAAPVFPQEKINKINADSKLSATEKACQISESINEYNCAVGTHKDSGGADINQSVREAVMNRLVKEHKFTTADKGANAYISPEELAVSMVQIPVGGQTYLKFTVTGTAKWG
jgi:hypothetical protein